MISRGRRRLSAGAALLALLLSARAHGDDAPVASITVTSATAGSSLGGQLVEGVMRFRDRDYLLTLHGVARSVTTRGSVGGLKPARAIEGLLHPSARALQNKAGLTSHLDPPRSLEGDGDELEPVGGIQAECPRA